VVGKEKNRFWRTEAGKITGQSFAGPGPIRLQNRKLQGERRGYLRVSNNITQGIKGDCGKLFWVEHSLARKKLEIALFNQRGHPKEQLQEICYPSQRGLQKNLKVLTRAEKGPWRTKKCEKFVQRKLKHVSERSDWQGARKATVHIQGGVQRASGLRKEKKRI